MKNFNPSFRVLTSLMLKKNESVNFRNPQKSTFSSDKLAKQYHVMSAHPTLTVLRNLELKRKKVVVPHVLIVTSSHYFNDITRILC